jgi:inner membrane protease subunit SOM1
MMQRKQKRAENSPHPTSDFAPAPAPSSPDLQQTYRTPRLATSPPTSPSLSLCTSHSNKPLSSKLATNTMAPTITPFHPADLESKIRILPTGKLRKPPNQQNLSECKLMEIMQFNCDVVKHSKHKNGIVICEPIQRVFRR